MNFYGKLRMICTNSWLLRMTFSMIFIVNIFLTRWLHLKFFFWKITVALNCELLLYRKKTVINILHLQTKWKTCRSQDMWVMLFLVYSQEESMLKKALFNFENVVVLSYSAKSKCFTGVRVMPLLLCIIGASSVQKLKSNANWKVFTFTLQFPIFSHKL